MDRRGPGNVGPKASQARSNQRPVSIFLATSRSLGRARRAPPSGYSQGGHRERGANCYSIASPLGTRSRRRGHCKAPLGHRQALYDAALLSNVFELEAWDGCSLDPADLRSEGFASLKHDGPGPAPRKEVTDPLARAAVVHRVVVAANQAADGDPVEEPGLLV